MRTPRDLVDDVELGDAVRAALARDPAVDHTRLRVKSRTGAVALSGTVTSHREKVAAVRAVERVYGVTAVADDVDVVLPKSARRTDADIAAEIARERQESTAIPGSVRIAVRDGVVTLRGVVRRPGRRDDAEAAVRRIEGVRRVSNMIDADPRLTPTAAYVERRVVQEIERSAALEAESVSASASGDGIRLTGTVHVPEARRLAQEAAESTPGVTHVEDDIAVAPEQAGGDEQDDSLA